MAEPMDNPIYDGKDITALQLDNPLYDAKNLLTVPKLLKGGTHGDDGKTYAVPGALAREAEGVTHEYDYASTPNMTIHEYDYVENSTSQSHEYGNISTPLPQGVTHEYDYADNVNSKVPKRQRKPNQGYDSLDHSNTEEHSKSQRITARSGKKQHQYDLPDTPAGKSAMNGAPIGPPHHVYVTLEPPADNKQQTTAQRDHSNFHDYATLEAPDSTEQKLISQDNHHTYAVLEASENTSSFPSTQTEQDIAKHYEVCEDYHKKRQQN